MPVSNELFRRLESDAGERGRRDSRGCDQLLLVLEEVEVGDVIPVMVEGLQCCRTDGLDTRVPKLEETKQGSARRVEPTLKKAPQLDIEGRLCLLLPHHRRLQ